MKKFLLLILAGLIISCSGHTPKATPTPGLVDEIKQFLNDVSDKSAECKSALESIASFATSIGDNPNLLQDQGYLDSFKEGLDQVKTSCTGFSEIKKPSVLDEINETLSKLDNEYTQFVSLTNAAIDSADTTALEQAREHVSQAEDYAIEIKGFLTSLIENYTK
jgi:archaellum component FlaC